MPAGPDLTLCIPAALAGQSALIYGAEGVGAGILGGRSRRGLAAARQYRRPVATSPSRGRPIVLTGFAALVLGTAACSGHSTASRPPAPPDQPPPAPVTEHFAHGRFTVMLSSKALQEANSAGFSLPALTGHALDRINALLPGPKTSVAVNYGRPGTLIPQAGANGFTDPLTGHITVAFGATPQASIDKALTLWLPRALSHEVDHSVRILAGPGFGPTLLPQIISEGISSVFDEAAFPGPPNPWDNAISQSQQCELWKKANFQLGYTGLYDLWMFGGYGVAALDRVHHRLSHHPGLPQPPSTHQLGRADFCQRNSHPGRQPLPALPAVSRQAMPRTCL